MIVHCCRKSASTLAQSFLLEHNFCTRPLSLLHRCLSVESGQRVYVNKSANTLDSLDIDRFERLANEWLDESGSFKPLHSFNQVRVPWVSSVLSKRHTMPYPLEGLRLLDIGCGGGILSIPLARLGARVDGVDASVEAVRSAEFSSRRILPSELHNNVAFYCASIEEFVKDHYEKYDGVIASEIIEHVSNVEIFVDSCVRACKRSGSLFFTTINKTSASNWLAIWLAEDVLRIVPHGIHEWDKFVTPQELRKMIKDRDCHVRNVQGLSYNPVTNQWSWCNWKGVNYALHAVKG